MKNSINRFKYLLILLFLTNISLVFAADFNILNNFTNIFGILSRFMQTQSIVYGLTWIFFFILLYGTYAASLSMLPVFKGAEGKGLSKNGKIVGVALAMLSTIGVFAFLPERLILENILSTFGVFTGIILAFLLGGIIYYGFRNENQGKAIGFALGAAALGMILAGTMTNRDSIMAWGWFIALIALIIGIISSMGSGNSDGSGRGDGSGKSRDGKGDDGKGKGGDGKGKGDGDKEDKDKKGKDEYHDGKGNLKAPNAVSGKMNDAGNIELRWK